MSQVGTTPEGVPIILFKEGTRQSRGRDAQRNNIREAKLIAEIIQTSPGPRGMDKMLVDSIGDENIELRNKVKKLEAKIKELESKE